MQERVNKCECCDASKGSSWFKSTGLARTEGQRATLSSDALFALLPPAGLVLYIPSTQLQNKTIKTFIGDKRVRLTLYFMGFFFPYNLLNIQ